MDKLNSTLNYMLHTRANKERQYLNRDHIKATDARQSAEYAGQNRMESLMAAIDCEAVLGPFNV